MRRNRKIALALSACVGYAALFSLTLHTALAADPGDGTAIGQFRRTVDPSERSAYGTVNLQIKGGKEICTVQIHGLGATDFGIYVTQAPSPSDAPLLYGVAPLDRTNPRLGGWMRHFVGKDGSPVEFPIALEDLEGGMIVIGNLMQDNNIIQFTNVVFNTTNTVDALPLPLTDNTNVVGAILWAPIPPVVADPGKGNFAGRAKLDLPANPPSPRATGQIVVHYDAASGRSQLNVYATNLDRGQTYTVFIADSVDPNNAVLVDAGTMTGNSVGFAQSFARDTLFGDPLPQQARNVVDLSGRLLVVRDALANIHLSGTIP